jgi:hypothetical protein
MSLNGDAPLAQQQQQQRSREQLYQLAAQQLSDGLVASRLLFPRPPARHVPFERASIAIGLLQDAVLSFPTHYDRLARQNQQRQQQQQQQAPSSPPPAPSQPPTAAELALAAVAAPKCPSPSLSSSPSPQIPAASSSISACFSSSVAACEARFRERVVLPAAYAVTHHRLHCDDPPPPHAQAATVARYTLYALLGPVPQRAWPSDRDDSDDEVDRLLLNNPAIADDNRGAAAAGAAASASGAGARSSPDPYFAHFLHRALLVPPAPPSPPPPPGRSVDRRGGHLTAGAARGELSALGAAAAVAAACVAVGREVAVQRGVAADDVRPYGAAPEALREEGWWRPPSGADGSEGEYRDPVLALAGARLAFSDKRVWLVLGRPGDDEQQEDDGEGKAAAAAAAGVKQEEEEDEPPALQQNRDGSSSSSRKAVCLSSLLEPLWAGEDEDQERTELQQQLQQLQMQPQQQQQQQQLPPQAPRGRRPRAAGPSSSSRRVKREAEDGAEDDARPEHEHEQQQQRRLASRLLRVQGSDAAAAMATLTTPSSSSASTSASASRPPPLPAAATAASSSARKLNPDLAALAIYPDTNGTGELTPAELTAGGWLFASPPLLPAGPPLAPLPPAVGGSAAGRRRAVALPPLLPLAPTPPAPLSPQQHRLAALQAKAPVLQAGLVPSPEQVPGLLAGWLDPECLAIGDDLRAALRAAKLRLLQRLYGPLPGGGAGAGAGSDAGASAAAAATTAAEAGDGGVAAAAAAAAAWARARARDSSAQSHKPFALTLIRWARTVEMGELEDVLRTVDERRGDPAQVRAALARACPPPLPPVPSSSSSRRSSPWTSNELYRLGLSASRGRIWEAAIAPLAGRALRLRVAMCGGSAGAALAFAAPPGGGSSSSSSREGWAYWTPAERAAAARQALPVAEALVADALAAVRPAMLVLRGYSPGAGAGGGTGGGGGGNGGGNCSRRSRRYGRPSSERPPRSAEHQAIKARVKAAYSAEPLAMEASTALQHLEAVLSGFRSIRFESQGGVQAAWRGGAAAGPERQLVKVEEQLRQQQLLGQQQQQHLAHGAAAIATSPTAVAVAPPQHAASGGAAAQRRHHRPLSTDGCNEEPPPEHPGPRPRSSTLCAAASDGEHGGRARLLDAPQPALFPAVPPGHPTLGAMVATLGLDWLPDRYPEGGPQPPQLGVERSAWLVPVLLLADAALGFWERACSGPSSPPSPAASAAPAPLPPLLATLPPPRRGFGEGDANTAAALVDACAHFTPEAVARALEAARALGPPHGSTPGSGSARLRGASSALECVASAEGAGDPRARYEADGRCLARLAMPDTARAAAMAAAAGAADGGAAAGAGAGHGAAVRQGRRRESVDESGSGGAGGGHAAAAGPGLPRAPLPKRARLGAGGPL